MKRFILWATVGVIALQAPAPVHAANEPHIGYVYPAGAQQGTAIEVTLGGQFLEGATNLHVVGGGLRAEFVGYHKELTRQEINRLRNQREKLEQSVESMEGEECTEAEEELARISAMFVEQGFAMDGKRRKRRPDPKKQPNAQIAEEVTLRITVDAQAKKGVREVRLITAEGLSNPLLFHVGELAEFREVEPNDRAPAEDLHLALPSVLNGQIMPGDVDRFRIEAKQGQRLVLRADARSLIPYLADAVPGWFQATLALSDAEGREVAFVDDHGFNPDPALAFDVPADGAYVVEIRDSIYRGREDFVYRVTLGDVPMPKGARFPALSGDASATPEQEPNHAVASAQTLVCPAVVEGCIEEAGDWDVFRFEGRAGETVVAEVLARRCGSPLDAVVKLTDAQGACLAVNDDHEDRGAGLVTHHADSYVRHTLPADGAYAVHLGDIQHKGSADHTYRLRIGAARPDFGLRVCPGTVNIPPGGTVPITVHALRRDGFEGDIRLSLVDPPRGFRLSGNVVPTGRAKVRLTLSAPWKPQHPIVTLAMQGEASVAGQTVRRRAVPAEDMMQAFLWRHLVPVEKWVVAVTGRPRRNMVADVPEGEAVEIRLGGKTEIRLHSPNGKPIKARPRFELDDPPAGLSVAKGAVKPGTNEAFVVLRAKGASLEVGQRGNLILNAVAPRGRKKHILWTSRAIPFEIVSR